MKKIFTNQWVKMAFAATAFAAVMLWGTTLKAQNLNLAPLATSAIGWGSSPPGTGSQWNWNRINDLSYSSCYTQEAFIWTTSPPDGTEYMEWQWSQQYPINKITIHHADIGGRFLAGGTVQYWNGSSWINHYTFTCNQANCVNDINFSVCVTNKLRIANWVPGTGQNSNLNYREIEIWQGAKPGTHATAFDVYMKNRNCGSTNDSGVVEVRNIGLNTLKNFWVGVKIVGTANGSPVSVIDSVLYTDSITTGKTVAIKTGKVNNINGSNVTITGWVHAAGDGDPTDDTKVVTISTLGGVTSNPSPTNNSRCGSGSVALTGGAVSGNTVFWYDAPTGGKLLGIGNNFNTPPVAAPSTRTFYAAGAKISGDSSFSTGFAGTSYAGAGFQGGSAFDVNVKKAVTIDSLSVHLNLSNIQKVSIYVKQGSQGGTLSTPGAWTLVHRGEVKSKGAGNATNIVLATPLVLSEGLYGFYIYANENLIFQQINAANIVVGNTALDVIHGVALRDSFSAPSIIAPPIGNAYAWNGRFYYHESCPSATRLPVTATAKPLAVGAQLGKGANFKGTYDAGTSNQPDIVANPDDIEYDLVPPTGFANSAYGSTWNITSIVAKTVNGTTIPSGDLVVTNPAGSTNGKIKYKPSSTYTDSTIILTVNIRRLDNGCDTALVRYIFDAPRPKADFVFTTPCDGEEVAFASKSTIVSGTMSYDWSFGDSNKSTFAEPGHLYSTYGSYTVTLRVISNLGYIDSITKTVAVGRLPEPDFDFSNACEGTAVTLADASFLPPGTATHTWSFSDNSTQTGTTASKLYAQPGIYPVKLTVTVNGCTDSKTKYVTQAPRGIPSFTVDVGNCDNATVTFTSTNTAPEFGSYSNVFNFGDGDIAAGNVVKHTYNGFSSYNAVMYASTDLGCVDSATVSVVLRESPRANFALTGAVCTNESVVFTNNTNVPAASTNTYEWQFGDAFTSTNDNPTHTYPSSGTYTVTLKASSTNGCESQTTSDITINEKPTADFSVVKVCLGTPSEFKNNSTVSTGPLTYAWDLGNSNSSTATNPVETYASAGNYNVSLIATTANGCTDTSVVTAIVAAIPTVDINIASGQTGDGRMLFATSTTGVTYKWQFGDGGSSEDQNPIYTFPFGAKWSVKLTVTSPDGCVNSTTTSVFVNPLSTQNVTNNNIVVYPNPSTGLFYLQFNGNSDVENITVTDMLGKKVADFKPVKGNEIAFDISGQNAGVYFMTITDADGKIYSNKITLSK